MRNNALLLESNIATAIVTELAQCTCTVWVTAFTWVWNARCSELTLRNFASSCHTFQYNRFNSSSHIMIFLTFSRAYPWLHTVFEIHWTESDTESVVALKCSAWAEVLVQPFVRDLRKHLDTKQQLTLRVEVLWCYQEMITATHIHEFPCDIQICEMHLILCFRLGSFLQFL